MADCGVGNHCRAPIGFEIEVEIWGQNFVKNNSLLPAPCNSSSCIRREHTNDDCHEVFTFSTTAPGGNIDAATANGAWTCNGNVSLGFGEIRAIEVRIVEPDLNGGAPELLGVMSYGQW